VSAAALPRHVYIHVPFCRAKCDYCDFASVPVGEKPSAALLDDFVAAVAAEWELEQAAHSVRRLHTLYVGGGTPSLLGPARLERLLELFRPCLTPHAEVTVEANPEDVTAALAEWAAARGLRISLGVQSFDAGLRAALGRRAKADPAAAFARLRAADVSELSVDLIFGVPGQTPAMLDADLAAVARLWPAHVSWYELDVVPGTPLAARREPRPDDDARASLYRRVVAGLARLGYRWYEVSNFALPGHRSRHNLAYWRGRDYLGLGPGAVSTVGARRWQDRPDVSAYCAALAAGREPPRRLERLDETAQRRERLLLAARIGAPVPLATLAGALDADALPPLAAAGFISLHGGTLTVTRKGRYVANEVCVRLFRA
jgi:oxygen-independent coproporphyrinogen-3 oxidase